jgi:Flp pilus assembly protein TadG
MLRRFNSIRRYFASDSGSILPIAALLFPVILGLAGLAVDASNWLMTKRQMQAAADAAAVAGAWELAHGGTESDAAAAALREATSNGYDDSLAPTTLDPVYTAGTGTYSVTVQQAANIWFSRMFVDGTLYVSATASAQETAASAVFCALALGTSGATITTSGSSSVTSSSCGIADNSTSNPALTAGGSSSINVKDITLVGGYTPSSNIVATDGVTTGATAIADPYASISVPSPTSCTNNAASNVSSVNHSTNIGSNTTWNASGGTLWKCGGFHIVSGSTLTLQAGTYVIDGAGGLDMTSGSIIGAGGVTLIFTNSFSTASPGGISLSGSGAIQLTAPTTGTYKGIALYQDRRASVCITNSCTNTINGNGTVDIQGAVYTPSRALSFGGTSGASNCTQMIGQKVIFSGNTALQSSCSGAGTTAITGSGTASVKMVL